MDHPENINTNHRRSSDRTEIEKHCHTYFYTRLGIRLPFSKGSKPALRPTSGYSGAFSPRIKRPGLEVGHSPPLVKIGLYLECPTLLHEVVVSKPQELHLTSVKTKLQPRLKRTGKRYDTTAMHVGSYVTVSRGRLRSIPASYSGSPGYTTRCENRV